MQLSEEHILIIKCCARLISSHLANQVNIFTYVMGLTLPIKNAGEGLGRGLVLSGLRYNMKMITPVAPFTNMV